MCNALFEFFRPWSGVAWKDACARGDFCKVDGCFIFLEYPLFRRAVASVGLEYPDSILRRASGIFLLWLKMSLSK